MSKTVYLGKVVKDTGKPGLDNLREVRDICAEIINDYLKGKISYAKAMRRLNFLKTTVIKRDSKLEGKKRKAYAIVENFKKKLRKLREKVEKKKKANSKSRKKGKKGKRKR
ncbi:hypothetical protein [Thermococcus barophilus]|uniref:Uncharacterized protein n=1 Tax=Thermococcus barophilus TaxID=55802 RepID=A0A0S1XFH0_THEBA|nr:hypothetical protein [Thermococcus barophilus]ALM76464.1 hypothetical protein TBCH5v1_2575 [Thermococcus barophilus]